MNAARRFRRRGGGITRDFTPIERDALIDLCRQLTDTLALAPSPTAAADPVLRRLLPDAYPDDPDAGAEFADAVRQRLADGKSERLRRIVTDLGTGQTVRLDAAASVEWLQGIGDLRLAVAERLGLDSLGDTGTAAGELYAWLGYLQADLVDVVAR